MTIQRLPVNDYLIKSEGRIILDVRSPAEYEHGHVPGAISFPLFTNDERKIVGTIYKQQSREEAIKTGLDFFGVKMKGMIELVEQIINKSKIEFIGKPDIFVYCWRGGMRSAGIAWLLDLYGFKVYTLAGGYKAFRNEVLLTFSHSYKLQLLGGFTGSGKTLLLQKLKDLGENVIDLESLACHRGSAFGSYKMPAKPTQEMFENRFALLLKSIIKLNEGRDYFIWVEDESQRIGDINIPGTFWNQMRKSNIIFLDIPFEKRLEHIILGYGDCHIDKLKESVTRIRKRLGGLDYKNTMVHLENGEIKEAFMILLEYYDKLYLKGLHNRETVDSLLKKVNCEKITDENVYLLLKKIQQE